MTTRPIVRRPLVILGALLTLFVAVATVRAASEWAASASLAKPPATISSIEAALAREQSRSAVLQDQLDAMRASSADLQWALVAANNQVATDQTTADALQASLAAAKARLAKLEAALRAAAARNNVTTTSSGSGGTTAPAPVCHDDCGGGDD
jgi:chromosome segregation ATPase